MLGCLTVLNSKISHINTNYSDLFSYKTRYVLGIDLKVNFYSYHQLKLCENCNYKF